MMNPGRDGNGNFVMGMAKSAGLSDGTMVSHDFCDKTTWYEMSTEHTGVTLSEVDPGVSYKHASHSNWIDLTHGKLYGEDALGDQKEPVIYDGGTPVDSSYYSIDYATGIVTFDGHTPVGAITADFWKCSTSAGASRFTLAPKSGKNLLLEHAELQFAEDIMMSAAITFEIWVYNPADLPNKIKYKEIKYKNIKDLINAANLGQGFIPKISGLTQNVIVFPFNYISTKILKSAEGAEIRLLIEGDTEFTGEFGTATFYFLSEDE